MNIKKENVKKYSDFCSPYYYFYDIEEEEKENGIEEENDDKIDDSENFINTLNENVITELKHTRYSNEKKIIRIFGPKKNGKSTLIYYYFGMRRYIPNSEEKLIDDFINKEIMFKIKDITYNNDINNIDNSIVYLEETEKIFEDNIHFIKEEYNKEMKREEKLEASNDIPFYNSNYDNILKTFSLYKNNDKKFDITLSKNNQNTIFQKEFNITRNDLIGFFRSCYLNNDFFKSTIFSNENKEKTLFYEFEGLFKSYSIYKFFITKFMDFYDYSKNIIQIAYFVLNFMMKYNKNNARYFIILDSLSSDLFKELDEFESDARKDNNCFIIEIYKNEKIENIFYNNIISPKLEDDILVIYESTYSDISLVDDLTQNEKQFLLTNFGNSLFYYQKFKKIKNENKFLKDNINEVEQDLLKDFSNKDEGKAFYIYLLLKIERNDNINDENIIKKLNLNYFFIQKEEDSIHLKLLPFVENIIRNFKKMPLENILYTEFFQKNDEYSKGSILEYLEKNEIKKYL